ncbi:MAG TPA: hypothetical protein VE422_13950 [Terriglobia bacterium]|nr:hypothetical protein [Terriglobia bacterium]
MRITIETDEHSATTVTEQLPKSAATQALNAGPPAASLVEAIAAQAPESSSSPQVLDSTNGGPPSPDLVAAIQTLSPAQSSLAEKTSQEVIDGGASGAVN